MKKITWIYPLIIMGILLLFTSSCKEDDAPNYPEIRLKTDTGLNNGLQLYFLALSKNVNYSDFSPDQLFSYIKTDADWYINGDVVPFTTEYKSFAKSTGGNYYLLLSASGWIVTTQITLKAEKQTILISSRYGTIYFDVVQP
jgi:hypothetical protein